MRCPKCKVNELVELKDSWIDEMTCEPCGLDFDYFHIELIKKNEILIKALYDIIGCCGSSEGIKRQTKEIAQKALREV